MKKQVKYPYVITDIFVCLVFSLFLLFPGTGGYGSIQDEKSWMFYVLFGGYLFIMLLFTAETMLVGWIKPTSPLKMWKKATWAQRFIVLYFLTSLVSTLASPYRDLAWKGMSRYEGMITIGLYCGVALCVSVFGTPKKRTWKIFSLSMCIFCIICILQMLDLNPLGLYPAELRYSDANKLYAGVYLGTIGNADLVAALLCLAIPIFLMHAVNDGGKKEWIIITALVLSVIVLFWMDVKAGLVGLFIGLWFSAPTAFPMNVRNKRRMLLAVPVCTSLALLLIWAVPFDGILYEIHQCLHGNWADEFGSGRIYIWKQVLQKSAKQILLGSGPDTMMAANIAGFDFIGELGFAIETFVDTAHNEYLNVLFHQGVFALVAFIGILVSCMVKWFRLNQWDRHTAGLGCAVMCYCVQAMFGLSMCLTAGFFWVVLGMFLGVLNQADKGDVL